MRAQKLVPMCPQSSWDVSELGTWAVQCSCQGSRNTTGAVTALPGWLSRRGGGRETRLLSLTEWPGVFVALSTCVCLRFWSSAVWRNKPLHQALDGFSLLCGRLRWEAEACFFESPQGGQIDSRALVYSWSQCEQTPSCVYSILRESLECCMPD